MKIYELLKKLIEKKFYAEKESIERKLNVFYAMSKISDEEFAELTMLVEETYKVVENTTEETVENTEIENETVKNEENV